MATCSLLGQAAGTAAALCVRHSAEPADISNRYMDELQTTLMDDDSWLPGHARPSSDLPQQAEIIAEGSKATVLRNGHEREIHDDANSVTVAPGSPIEFRWGTPVDAGAARVVFDSNLRDLKRMPHTYSLDGFKSSPPKTLVKAFRIEGEVTPGTWETLYQGDQISQRLNVFPVEKTVHALRFIPEATWGAEQANIFSIDVLPDYKPKTQPIKKVSWHEVMAAVPEEDLAVPELEGKVRGSRFGA
jgi:hypothetical protein